MSNRDIAAELRRCSTHALMDASRSIVLEAAREIERLNNEVSVLLSECQRQKHLIVNGATLTRAERAAVETAALEAEAHQHTQRAATLRGLLERLK